MATDALGEPADSRTSTIGDVARHAKVSTATVSRVLNGNYPVADATRERVLHAVAELHYTTNAHARALASAATRTVGIILNDFVDPFFSHILRGVEQQVSVTGHLAIVGAAHGDGERELTLIDRMREQRADAVIVVGGTVSNEKFRRRLAERAHILTSVGSQLVLCGRPPLGNGAPTKNVSYDNEGGAFAITEHLISQGHERILYLGGPADLSTTTDRLAGYRRALQSRGLHADDDLVHVGAFGRRFGYDRTRELIDSGILRNAESRRSEAHAPTAVFAANDLVAAGALEALTAAGISVPYDVSLVGYDDIPQSFELSPKLTTVHVPLEEMGRESVRIALNEADPFDRNPGDSVTLGTHVVTRDSTDRPVLPGPGEHPSRPGPAG